jgi:hypothetical protein
MTTEPTREQPHCVDHGSANTSPLICVIGAENHEISPRIRSAAAWRGSTSDLVGLVTWAISVD